MYKIFKFFWFLTMIITIAVIVYVYTAMPDGSLNLPFPGNIDKTVLFFYTLVVLVALSLLIAFGVSYLHQKRGIEKQSTAITKALRLGMIGYLWALGIIINVMTIFTKVTFFLMNIPHGDPDKIMFWNYLGPLLLVIWVFSFGFFVSKGITNRFAN